MNRLNGSIAEAKAILHFTENGYDVFTPVTVNPKVDLVVIKDNVTSKVQVKSAITDTVNLRTSYTSSKKTVRTPFDGSLFDLLFVWHVPSDTYKVAETKNITNIKSISYKSL